ncbi:MAG: hypothetical protein JWP87_2480 [Labilithrix sp.]|jgi:hypothetical protein|nr:hypothetical protein [Labilithrix sp.]
MTHVLDVEQVDLAELCSVLRGHESELQGELEGRAVMRDIVAERLGCSMLEAENLVDTLVLRGYARLEHDPERGEGWVLAMPQPDT